jgi:hypothetical protein
MWLSPAQPERRLCTRLGIHISGDQKTFSKTGDRDQGGEGHRENQCNFHVQYKSFTVDLLIAEHLLDICMQFGIL